MGRNAVLPALWGVPSTLASGMARTLALAWRFTCLSCLAHALLVPFSGDRGDDGWGGPHDPLHQVPAVLRGIVLTVLA